MNERTFYTIDALRINNISKVGNRRNQNIAERLLALYDDAENEDQRVQSESLTQVIHFFRDNPYVDLPKIMLTPDGTMHAYWMRGAEEFVAIEFLGGKGYVTLTTQIRRDGGWERCFRKENIGNVVAVAESIGAPLIQPFSGWREGKIVDEQMDEQMKETVRAYWENIGKAEFMVYGRAHIEDMCYMAITRCHLDLLMDDHTLHELAIDQAKSWGLDWIDR